ncbi:MAG TPA: ABC transporter permease subunit [Polyangia bacterium]|nr:ABC transporter permease subunit [Polyangia bacterium]
MRLCSNPILVREITHRMRDNRTYFVPVVYLSILAIVTLGVYTLSAWDLPGMPTQGWRIGESIFNVISFVQLALTLLLVPSVSAAAITSERDRKTLVPLLVTPLSRTSIALGKLLAPILYILLLVCTSLPFAALSFGFGGADFHDLGVSYGCIVATTLFVAALGLFISTIMKRTVPAVLLAYGAIAFLVLGSLIGDLVLNVLWLGGGEERAIMSYLNPFLPLVTAMVDEPYLREKLPSIWITPALELGLAAAFFGAALARIRKMRD